MAVLRRLPPAPRIPAVLSPLRSTIPSPNGLLGHRLPLCHPSELPKGQAAQAEGTQGWDPSCPGPHSPEAGWVLRTVPYPLPHPRVPLAKWSLGHRGPLYARQEQSLRSPALPLASAHHSPPPQKFLQLMGNPTASRVSQGPGAGWGMRPQGTVPPAHPASPARGSALPLGKQQLGSGEQSQGSAGAQCPRGDAGAASALHHLLPGASSPPREEEEEEKGSALALLGCPKLEVRPCMHPPSLEPYNHQPRETWLCPGHALPLSPGRWRWVTSASVWSLCPVAGGDSGIRPSSACASGSAWSSWRRCEGCVEQSLWLPNMCDAGAGRSGATPALPSPPPRHRLSLPAVYVLLAKFPSTHEAPSQLVSMSVQWRARGKGPSNPSACGEWGTEGLCGCHIPLPLGPGTPGSHQHGQASHDCTGGASGDPSGTPGCPGTAWGHASLRTSLPPLEHHRASAKSQTDGAECSGDAMAGDMSYLCGGPGTLLTLLPVDSDTRRAPCQAAVGREPVSTLALCPGALGPHNH